MRATVFHAREPVRAGIVGRFAGERPPALALVGAGFTVGGITASEPKPPRKAFRNHQVSDQDSVP